jgi:hypothetical protein
MLKEAVVANLRYCPGIYLEGLSKTTKNSVRIAGLRDEYIKIRADKFNSLEK